MDAGEQILVLWEESVMRKADIFWIWLSGFIPGFCIGAVVALFCYGLFGFFLMYGESMGTSGY